MHVDRTPAAGPSPARTKEKTTEPHGDVAPKAHVARDQVALSHAAKPHEAPGADHPLDDGHGDTHAKTDSMKDLAHKVHNPHGALHAIEAGEHGLAALTRLGTRVAGTASRAASTVAEAAEVADHHHGLVAKFEHGVARGIARTGNWLGQAVSKLPGGARLVKGLEAAAAGPGRATGAAAKAIDGALVGTRVGNAVRVTGSAGRFVANVGGRIPVIGAVLGGVIGAVDVKDAVAVLKDPKATTRDKVVSGTQGLLSGASGLLGVGALGVAGALALGLTAPVSVPALLIGAAVTGVGAFALSFFKKQAH